jgi:hypothetical protein
MIARLIGPVGFANEALRALQLPALTAIGRIDAARSLTRREWVALRWLRQDGKCPRNSEDGSGSHEASRQSRRWCRRASNRPYQQAPSHLLLDPEPGLAARACSVFAGEVSLI